MKQTIYLISQDSDNKSRKFESIEAALRMNPIIIIEEKIDDNNEYSYCLYNSRGEITDIIEIDAWKFKLTGVSNGNSYPNIYFDLIDPSGELIKYNIGDRAIWAFEKAVSKLREANNFNNYKTFQVFEKNKELSKEIERLKLEIKKLTKDENQSL